MTKMTKWITMILTLVMCLSLCACSGGDTTPVKSEVEEGTPESKDMQEANDESYVKISTSSTTIPCKEYTFEIEEIKVNDEYYENLGLATLEATIKNTSDKSVDFAEILFIPLDSDYNTLGLSYNYNGFNVTHLKVGRTMTVTLELSEVNPEDICYLEYTNCEVFEDIEEGAARTTIARQDLFDDDISVEFK